MVKFIKTVIKSLLLFNLSCMSQEHKYPANQYFTDSYLEVANLIIDNDIEQIRRVVTIRNLDLKKPGQKGYTLLAWAVLIEKPSIIKLLIDLGSNSNQILDDGKNRFQVLGLAIVNQNKNIFKLLLENGSDPNSRYNSEPAIHRLILQQRWEEMRYILDKGADINSLTGVNESPVLLCATINQFEQVAYLIGRGADFLIESNSGGSVALEVQEFPFDTSSENGKWRNKVKLMLEERGVTFPVKRPWEKE